MQPSFYPKGKYHCACAIGQSPLLLIRTVNFTFIIGTLCATTHTISGKLLLLFHRKLPNLSWTFVVFCIVGFFTAYARQQIVHVTFSGVTFRIDDRTFTDRRETSMVCRFFSLPSLRVSK